MPPEGHGRGGLALFWKAGINLSVLKACKNYIDTEITYEGKTFHSTFIYGDTDKTNRKQTWDDLAALSSSRNTPWLLSGDFNDITGNQEKSGGVTRREGSFIDFRTFLSSCDLFDLSHSGDFLSWRGVRGNDVVRCRLDRTITNNQWFDIFFAGRCEYLKFEASDHKPIVTCFDVTRKKKKGLFRFDRRLKDKPEVKELIAQTWKGAVDSDVEGKIILIRRKEIEQRKKELDQALSSPDNNTELINKINCELNKAYLEEEALWK